MYDYAKPFVRHYIQYQRHRNINTRDAMPLTSNLQIDIFNVWGINFMGSFPNSEGREYILVVIDYVSKWVEALPCRAADAMHSKKIFHEIIFLRYGVPRIVTLHWSDILKSSLERGSWSPDWHSISPSDERSSKNIEQANQEYPSDDSESNGQKLEEQAQ
jgi:hypothetical protein